MSKILPTTGATWVSNRTLYPWERSLNAAFIVEKSKDETYQMIESDVNNPQ